MSEIDQLNMISIKIDGVEYKAKRVNISLTLLVLTTSLYLLSVI